MKNKTLTLTSLLLLASCGEKEPTIHLDLSLPRSVTSQDIYSLYSEMLFEPTGITFGPEDWTDEKVVSEYSRLHGDNAEELLVKRFYKEEKFHYYLIYKLKTPEEISDISAKFE